MKRIDVVELYLIKRIEVLERENGKYDLHTKVIKELKDVLDVINRINHAKQIEEDEDLQLLSDTLDKIDKCLSKTEED